MAASAAIAGACRASARCSILNAPPINKFKKTLFFSRKETKDFSFLSHSPLGGHGRDIAACAKVKVFWFFSSEKNDFSTIQARSNPHGHLCAGRAANEAFDPTC
jgi:hypothetical protein